MDGRKGKQSWHDKTPALDDLRVILIRNAAEV
jgi:hypothetical protein